MSKPAFIYVIFIEAPREKVWEALTNGEHTQHFWSRYVQSEWKQGSRVEFLRADKSKLSHDGVVLEIDPPNRLVMTFDVRAEGMNEKPSRVTYELEERPGETKLTVIHDDFPLDSKVLTSISNGWPAILSSMKTYLERGAAMAMTARMRRERGE
jgi:uncharacterized protein YndB with AHSA1/START domain